MPARPPPYTWLFDETEREVFIVGDRRGLAKVLLQLEGVELSPAAIEIALQRLIGVQVTARQLGIRDVKAVLDIVSRVEVDHERKWRSFDFAAALPYCEGF